MHESTSLVLASHWRAAGNANRIVRLAATSQAQPGLIGTKKQLLTRIHFADRRRRATVANPTLYDAADGSLPIRAGHHRNLMFRPLHHGNASERDRSADPFADGAGDAEAGPGSDVRRGGGQRRAGHHHAHLWRVTQRRGRFRIAGPSEHVRRLFEITHTASILPLDPDLVTSVKKLQEGNAASTA